MSNTPKTKGAGRQIRSVPTPAEKAPVSNSFVLSDELDELTYDFRPYVDVHGVIPEPSPATIKKFQKVVRKAMNEAFTIMDNMEGKTELEQVRIALGMENDEAKSDEDERAVLQSFADLCSGSPSSKEIGSLPFRGQAAFTGWLTGIFLNPEA